MKVKSESEVTQSGPTLHDPMDCSPPGSSIHGIFQARVLERGVIAFSRSCPQLSKRAAITLRPEPNTLTSGYLFTLFPNSSLYLGIAAVVQSLSRVQFCCCSMDYSPPGSSVHGISQARTLERVAISFSTGSSQCRESHLFRLLLGR